MQVLDERVYHIDYIPSVPEPYNKPTGNELQPRSVGEENGVVVFNYNPVSAVNYVSYKFFIFNLLFVLKHIKLTYNLHFSISIFFFLKTHP